MHIPGRVMRQKKSGLVGYPPGNPAEPERIGKADQLNFILRIKIQFLFFIM
jgi:hypothetical protein